MAPWATVLISVALVIGGGILRYLFKIERSLGTILATLQAQSAEIDDLKNFRLNIEQAKALIPHQRSTRRLGDIP